MHRYCNKTNEMVIPSLWCQCPSSAVSVLRISIPTASVCPGSVADIDNNHSCLPDAPPH